ncbi:MAG: DNA polymerase ligase N-terminal domain-containing protein [Pirellulaceae bacterium]|nr:DNA polymerase ligase N-terminal domain-containing protein [Pirellulaceae bacterium]
MQRFVFLRHELPAEGARGSHFDLMFEQAGVLRTWACDELPTDRKSTPAEQLPDHRLAYLDYQGPISAGRGSVRRVAAGEYQLLSETADELVARLMGEQYQGTLRIARAAGEPQRWSVDFAGEFTRD